MRKQPSKRAQKHFSKIQWHSMEKARTCMNQHYIDSILTNHYWWTSTKMNNYRGQCASITIRTMVWVDVFHIAGARTPRTFGIGRMVWGLLFWKAWQYTSWICGLCKKTKSLKMFYDSEESMTATTHLIVCLIGSNKGWIVQESTNKNMYLQLPSKWKTC